MMGWVSVDDKIRFLCKLFLLGGFSCVIILAASMFWTWLKLQMEMPGNKVIKPTIRWFSSAKGLVPSLREKNKKIAALRFMKFPTIEFQSKLYVQRFLKLAMSNCDL